MGNDSMVKLSVQLTDAQIHDIKRHLHYWVLEDGRVACKDPQTNRRGYGRSLRQAYDDMKKVQHGG